MSEDNNQLICFGNAILDIGKRLNSDELHRKYNLKLDDQLELVSETLESIRKDLNEM